MDQIQLWIVESYVPLSRTTCDSAYSYFSFVTNNPNQMKDNCKEIENVVPLSDLLFSPSPQRVSCFLLDNSKFSSSSPSLSPSTSDYSNPFQSLFLFVYWSYLSAQPSPSGLEPSVSYPAKNDSLEENACLNCKKTSRLPGETFSASYAFRNTYFPCRGTSPSIAERRGNNPPPRMMLPSVDDAPQVQATLARSWSFSLPDLEDDIMKDAECNYFEHEGSMNAEEITTEVDIAASESFQSVRHQKDHNGISHILLGDMVDDIVEATSSVLYL